METNNPKPSLMTRLKSFVIECRRIWQITKKPSKNEWFTIVKVTGIGMLVIGFIGFLVNVLWQLIFK
jgi:protein transport protein SEC61 subunit gamma-like protein